MAGLSPPLAPLFLLLLVAAAAVAPPAVTSESVAATFGLDFHHRFSDHVQRWADQAGWDAGGRPPERGTAEYYAALAEHDRALLHGRRLASGQGPVTFADGNSTARLSNLAFLYYTQVEIGTPNVTFLAALDTGSDLFWVPCDCQQCAPIEGKTYGFRKPLFFNTFSSNSSSTSKKVLCSSNLCIRKNSCSTESETCRYDVKYLSMNTTTSGYLLEDVLYMIADDSQKSPLQARVTIGCGQVQTGSFLVSGGFNGIIGLGLGKISVPSTLANSGITSNSFSMCFGRNDSYGRIVFGDRGSTDQETTPIMNSEQPSYLVSVMGLQLSNNSVSTSFKAFFDTGTSFTSLVDPAYTEVTQAFDALIPLQRVSLSQQQLFEYCYVASSNQKVTMPTLSLIMNGGSKYPVFRPIVHLVATTDLGTEIDLYCLGILKEAQLNIIGQNFMSGLKVVFDRETLSLGWKEFNCYDVESSKPLPTNPRNTSSPSFIGNGPDSTPKVQVRQTSGASGHSVHTARFLSQTVIWSAVVVCHLIQILFPLL